MKKLSMAFVALAICVFSCNSQPKNTTEINSSLKKHIERIKFSKLGFVGGNLVQLCTNDSAFRSAFTKKLGENNKVKRRTVNDEKEYLLSLHMLYQGILNANLSTSDDSGKAFLLQELANYKSLDFQIDEQLILAQIDISARSLINGYDEGAVNESMFIFFCFDPVKYKETLVKNNLTDSWNRTGVFICNHLRENENPIAIRRPIQEEIVERLIENANVSDILADIRSCDISTNLYD